MPDVPLLFCDTETTGLDPDLHEIWEVAAIRRDAGGMMRPRVWHLPVDLGRADPMALKIGRFHERYRGGVSAPSYVGGDGQKIETVSLHTFAQQFMQLANGCHLVGAIPSFDDQRLRKLLRANGACESWHYHLIDTEALAIGYLSGVRSHIDGGWISGLGDLKITPPWSSDDLTKALGIDVDVFDRHTALGDVQWAMAIYDEVMGHA